VSAKAKSREDRSYQKNTVPIKVKELREFLGAINFQLNEIWISLGNFPQTS
jgi:hypothetical protein